ncbi:MAG: Acyl-CoA dehydrogenase [Deltaproteobacteria bacterium]|nr:Acyl-CoA dehydrogenase [Deltaproteobacteria bacterium]
MKNFFQDNADIRFFFSHFDWPKIVNLYEPGFSEVSLYDYAPADAADAVDSYRRVLSVLGEIAAERSAPRGEGVDLAGSSFDGQRVAYAPGTGDSLEAFAKADLMGMTLPRRYGGLNFPAIIFTMAQEIVARADASLQNLFGLQGVAEIIHAFADEELKNKYLPLFCRGEVTGAMALTEAEAGSDLQNVKLKAVQDENGTWRLTGVKRFITNGNADVVLVLARSDFDEEGGLGLSLYLCEAKDGITVRRIEEKLGIHGSPTCELQFDGVPAQLIGERKRGLVTYVLALLNGARIGTAAQSIGIAQAALQEARGFAHARQQYGRRIETIPAVADLLAEMQVRIEAARALTYEAAVAMDTAAGTLKSIESLSEKADQGSAPPLKELKKDAKKYERLVLLLTPLAKYDSTEMSVQVTSDAIQVLGGSGYMKDYPVERYFRDARITTIYEGTSQLQIAAAVRSVISGALDRYLDDLSRECDGLAKNKALSGKLVQARSLLTRAVKYLGEKKDGRYIDLCARQLVDMAVSILIGYLFLRQSPHCARKKIIARRFISAMLPAAKMRCRQILSGENSTLKHFDAIVPLQNE